MHALTDDAVGEMARRVATSELKETNYKMQMEELFGFVIVRLTII